jgi:hypothetical protein
VVGIRAPIVQHRQALDSSPWRELRHTDCEGFTANTAVTVNVRGEEHWVTKEDILAAAKESPRRSTAFRRAQRQALSTEAFACSATGTKSSSILRRQNSSSTGSLISRRGLRSTPRLGRLDENVGLLRARCRLPALRVQARGSEGARYPFVTSSIQVVSMPPAATSITSPSASANATVPTRASFCRGRVT